MPALNAQELVGWSRMAKVWAKIHELNPGVDLRSTSLEPILTAAATGGVGMETALQTALDDLPVDKAKKYKDALLLLLNDYPAVCYTGVEDFKTSTSNKPQPPSNTTAPNPANREIHYTSAEFKAKAKVYCLVGQNAPTPFEFGFIQHCTSKSDVATYTNGSRMRDNCSAGFPVGDSSDVGDAPFYYKGVSHGCTDPAHRQLPAGENTFAFEVGDYFNNNMQYYHPWTTHNTQNTGATLTKINRDQAFTLWLARKKGNTERLLRQVTYRILVEVAVAPGVRTVTSVANINVTKPLFAAQRGNVTSPTMNNLSQWQYSASSVAPWANL